MLPTDLQLLARFKAFRPVLKLSGWFQSRPCQRTYMYAHYGTAGSREAGDCVQRMESTEESFSAFLSERFPPNVKRSTSGIFLAEFGRQVI